jgi:mRNA interferase MazF
VHCSIIQNDVGNKFSPTVIIAVITSRLEKTRLSIHIRLKDLSCGIEKNSIILLEQIRTLDRSRLTEYKGCLNLAQLKEVDRALQISFGLEQVQPPVVSTCGSREVST